MSEEQSLKTQIAESIKVAMRARDAQRLGTLRLLMAAIKQKEVDERIELSEAQVVAMVDKLIKQRRDSLSQFEQAGREDLAAQERAEILILTEYLPAQADATEIAHLVTWALASAGAQGPQDMGKVMALLKSKLAGRADLAQVSAQVKQQLGAA